MGVGSRSSGSTSPPIQGGGRWGGGSRCVLVLRDADDDDATRGVGERSHVTAEIPAISVAVAIEGALEVKVESLGDSVSGKRLNVAGAQPVHGRANNRLQTTRPKECHTLIVQPCMPARPSQTAASPSLSRQRRPHVGDPVRQAGRRQRKREQGSWCRGKDRIGSCVRLIAEGRHASTVIWCASACPERRTLMH